MASPILPGGAAVSSTLISIFWTNPPDIDINGAILFFLVEVREVATGRNFTFHAVNTQIVVGPLHPYFEYSCRVAIFTTALGPFSDYFSVLSGEDSEYHNHDNYTERFCRIFGSLTKGLSVETLQPHSSFHIRTTLHSTLLLLMQSSVYKV